MLFDCLGQVALSIGYMLTATVKRQDGLGSSDAFRGIEKKETESAAGKDGRRTKA